jgi:hypothetical protein
MRMYKIGFLRFQLIFDDHDAKHVIIINFRLHAITMVITMTQQAQQQKLFIVCTYSTRTVAALLVIDAFKLRHLLVCAVCVVLDYLFYYYRNENETIFHNFEERMNAIVIHPSDYYYYCC